MVLLLGLLFVFFGTFFNNHMFKKKNMKKKPNVFVVMKCTNRTGSGDEGSVSPTSV